MKTIIISALILAAKVFANAQTSQWGYDDTHAKVGFSISHFGISETEGKFTKFSGSVLSDKPDFSDAKVEITIDVNSINTEAPQRDAHLKSADFFDFAKFPSIVFKSKKLTAAGKNKYKLTGDITIHGVTKEIVLDVIYKGTVVDPFKNTKAGFKLSGTLNRNDFGLSWNGKLASGEILVGNEVELLINIELIKK